MTSEHSPTPEELMAYLDGELRGDTSHDIVAHLATCERCQHLADDLRGVSRNMRGWQVDEPPGTLRLPKAPAAAAPGYRARLWRVVRTRSFAAAAAVVVLVAAAIVAVNLRPRPRPAAASGVAAERVADIFATRPRLSTRAGGAGGGGGASTQPDAPGRTVEALVARTATLRIVAAEFDAVRPAIDRTLRDVGGFVGELSATDAGGGGRSIHATLRVPAGRLDDALSAFRGLGRVQHESQNAEDVTEQVIDLDARILNARITEKRLIDLIQNRTGRVSDVLEAEREIARVRTELERFDAQRKNVQRRVDYAIVVLDVAEQARATVSLGPQPVSARLRHAVADGVSSALSSLLGATLFLLRAGPAIVLWAMVLGLPAWWLIRRRAV